MHIFLIILAVLLWILAGVALFVRQRVAPVLSYAALSVLSFARVDGLQILPVNTVMLLGWFAITLIVTIVTVIQPPAVQAQSRGVGYMAAGGVAGLAAGLLGNNLTADPSLLYSIMVIAVAAGVFIGFLFYTGTPRGRELSIPTGRFFRYLLAKGFPVAVSLMMAGVPLVLLVLKLYTSTL